MLVLTESFKIYKAISEGLINLADRFFEMEYLEAVKGLEVYKESLVANQRLQVASAHLAHARAVASGLSTDQRGQCNAVMHAGVTSNSDAFPALQCGTLSVWYAVNQTTACARCLGFWVLSLRSALKHGQASSNHHIQQTALHVQSIQALLLCRSTTMPWRGSKTCAELSSSLSWSPRRRTF